MARSKDVPGAIVRERISGGRSPVKGTRDMKVDSLRAMIDHVRLGYRERSGNPEAKGTRGKPRGLSRRMRRFVHRHGR